VTYNHDSNGNRTSRTTPSSLTNYSYDYESRLESVNSGFITYGYLPNGKRINKTVGGVTTYYLYDGDDIIAEYDAGGTLIASYIHGPGVDEPIQMTRAGSTVYYTADGLGSIRDLTNSSQNIVEQYSYDSFGNLTTPPTTGNPYTFTAREYDTETGLLFYRARYYDPKVGRFLQEDPKGFDGGDVNFYAYVANNPINAVDPSGENAVLLNPELWKIVGALIGAYLLGQEIKDLSLPDSPPEDCDKGAYYRHYTSYSNLRNIVISGELWPSLTGDFGPGVYLTHSWIPPKWVTPQSSDTFIDVWIPDYIRNDPALWKEERFTIENIYLGGRYPIYNDARHPPLFGSFGDQGQPNIPWIEQ
jgi:RHS repeat-associated protein